MGFVRPAQEGERQAYEAAPELFPAMYEVMGAYAVTEIVDEADLKARRKGDTHKVSIAHRLRTDTTVTLKWIAKRLLMGGPTNVANLLREKKATSVKRRD